MTKYKNKYYFQYGAPGTEFSGYADGVVVGSKPLFDGIEKTPQSDPLSMKLGGFARGAGHGSTFTDNFNNYWHVSTIMVAVKNNFERRIGIWPAGFDKDDVMWCNTAFGDYPHYLPSATPHAYGSGFTGWMLLNYNKPVTVSSSLGNYSANYATDEDIKTYWSAATGNKGEWIQTDLGNISTVRALQINYADQDVASDHLGKINGGQQYHQYKIYYSADGKQWKTLIDKSNNLTDIPHDYVELATPVQARFIKMENIHMPTGKFALSGLRVFGHGNGSRPEAVKNFNVLRTEKDKRSAWLKWNPVNNAYAYNIYYGTAPDKLYNCIMVMDNTHNEYWFKAMDLKKEYYFTIEAVNENGTSEKFNIIKAQ
jgi:hypothetical protein